MKQSQTYTLPLLILAVLLCVLVFLAPIFGIYRYYIALAGLILAGILYLMQHGIATRRLREAEALMDQVFSENAGTASHVINEVSVPCVLVDHGGNIVWRNEIFQKLYDGENIKKIMPQYNAQTPLAAFVLEYAGGAYQVMSRPIVRKSVNKPLTFQYWLDRTEAAHYKRLYEEQMPYVALIYVDNYEELAADLQFHRATVIAEVERYIAETAAGLNGIYRRYENGRFLMVFEAKQLEAMESGKFELLEKVHRIDTGTATTVSMSIAVGVANRIVQSDESARQAMEFALGRGGDQAVIKSGTSYRFFGGKRQLESMQSRVKARLFSKALRQLFENAGDVFIMGHKHADMDCIGAALGVATCARSIGSHAFVVLDDDNAAIDRALVQMRENDAYAGMIVSPEQAEKMLHPTSVLVIVDTQRPSTTIAPKLIDMATRIVLIDHHRRSADYIDNTTLHYLESRASSASELITEVLQYFDDNLRPPAFVCGALLAGITVDTKHFAFNVGARTFDAAGYLRRNGADISMVKQLFQDDIESYNDCADTVRTAQVDENGIALACCAENMKNAKLIAAKVADELVGIRGIEAAFVLGRESGVISISGRSLGKVNVQLICEKLGGGGHLTMAGAQLHTENMAQAVSMVKESINQYIEEAKTIL